jgi:hypothetical protein
MRAREDCRERNDDGYGERREMKRPQRFAR